MSKNPLSPAHQALAEYMSMQSKAELQLAEAMPEASSPFLLQIQAIGMGVKASVLILGSLLEQNDAPHMPKEISNGNRAGALEADDDAVLTVRLAAETLGVSAATVRRWADQGTLPSGRTPGNQRRFKMGDVKALRDRTVSSD